MGWLEELQAELESLKKLEGPQQTLGLYFLYKKFLALRNTPASGCMPNSAIDDLAKAVPDKLVAEIVGDHRKGRSDPGWLPPDKVEPKPRGSGWLKPTPLEPPSGSRYVDQIAQHFAQIDKEQMIADAIDRVRKIKG
jgi:hypothetical protein